MISGVYGPTPGGTDFIEILNNHHALIKVEPVMDERQINFLDTVVYKGPDFEHTGLLAFGWGDGS